VSGAGRAAKVEEVLLRGAALLELRLAPCGNTILGGELSHRLPAFFQISEILQQHAVDKDVAAAHLAQQNALGGIVEEADVITGDEALPPIRIKLRVHKRITSHSFALQTILRVVYSVHILWENT
jgi:hypothetical protein